MVLEGFLRILRMEIAENDPSARTKQLVRIVAEFHHQLVVEIIDQADGADQVLRRQAEFPAGQDQVDEVFAVPFHGQRSAFKSVFFIPDIRKCRSVYLIGLDIF